MGVLTGVLTVGKHDAEALQVEDPEKPKEVCPAVEGMTSRKGASMHVRCGKKTFKATEEGETFLTNVVKALESCVNDGTLEAVSADELDDILASIVDEDVDGAVAEPKDGVHDGEPKPASIVLAGLPAVDRASHSQILNKVAERDWQSLLLR